MSGLHRPGSAVVDLVVRLPVGVLHQLTVATTRSSGRTRDADPFPSVADLIRIGGEQLEYARSIGASVLAIRRMQHRRSATSVSFDAAHGTVDDAPGDAIDDAGDGAVRTRPRVPVPPGALPIEGYDLLPASQIVGLLDALGPRDLERIDRYEQDHRGRRTILHRIGQLRATADPAAMVTS